MYLAPIEEGFSLSDEPGFYDVEKGFGIRIEADLIVEAATTRYEIATRLPSDGHRLPNDRRGRDHLVHFEGDAPPLPLGMARDDLRTALLIACFIRYAWGARPYLSFKYLSPIPMCRALLEIEIMDEIEIAWVDALHQRCRDEITEELLKAAALKGRCGGAAGAEADAKAAMAWLLAATEPLRGAHGIEPPIKRARG